MMMKMSKSFSWAVSGVVVAAVARFLSCLCSFVVLKRSSVVHSVLDGVCSARMHV